MLERKTLLERIERFLERSTADGSNLFGELRADEKARLAALKTRIDKLPPNHKMILPIFRAKFRGMKKKFKFIHEDSVYQDRDPVRYYFMPLSGWLAYDCQDKYDLYIRLNVCGVLPLTDPSERVLTSYQDIDFSRWLVLKPY